MLGIHRILGCRLIFEFGKETQAISGAALWPRRRHKRNHDAMSHWHVVLVALAGWLNQEQQKVIKYLKEENRVLREQLGTKRLRFTD
jgi:hypothetical protein